MPGIHASAQTTSIIDLAGEPPELLRGHLDLGGSNPRGDTIAVTNQYIEWNGRPFFPVVAEFHYSRYPAAYWEESLRKIKAGGINLVATYVFWNLHERQPGRFDWSGNLDLREFISVCEKVGLHVIVRLGPFCHGEIRNGGLPDWLYGREFEVRSNDPGYLQLVDRLYGEIAAQIRDELFAVGGPIVGVQLENEYQHSAAPWEIAYPGSPREFTVAERDLDVTHIQVSASDRANAHAAEGRAHMANLKQLAKKHGIDVPLYTATGWGNAAIVEGGSIPVTAAYAYPFWAPPAPSPFYLYKDIRRHPDYSPVSYDPGKYPSISAEIGPGIMTTYARRPRVDPASVAPLIVRTLGSGSNGIGYYMYHGGSTPVFGHFYSEERGGLPKINYDFQAPIGEFGQLRPHFHSLKPLHLLLESWGSILATMHTVLPPGQAELEPTNMTTLRHAVRTRDGAGFVFMHNFQDHLETPDLPNQRVVVRAGKDEIAFPSRGTFTLPSGTAAILPFNLDLDGLKLRSATVQPLTTFREGDRVHVVFFSIPGLPPELVLVGAHAITASGAEVETRDGVTTVRGEPGKIFTVASGAHRILVVPQSLALQTWKLDEQRIAFSEAAILPEKDTWRVLAGAREVVDVNVYPASALAARTNGAKVEKLAPLHSAMAAFRLRFTPVAAPFTAGPITSRKVRIRATEAWGTPADVMMTIDYVGDRCMAFFEGDLVADHFYFGQPWEIGLRKFRERFRTQDMILVFHPVRRDHAFLSDLEPSARPPFKEGQESFLRIGDISFATHYEAVVALD